MKLKYFLPILFSPFILIPFVLIAIVFVTIMIGSIVMLQLNNNMHNHNFNIEFMNLSEQVLEYKPLVEEIALQEGISEYVPVILAIMMQESGGSGNDPMQVSEAVCGSIGCIDNPYQSIEEGVKNFKRLIEKANGNLLVALQAYNFGSYFIDWINEKGGQYSQELATQFSREMYQKEVSRGRGGMYGCRIGNAKELGSCYGDYLYVQHVLRYLNYGSTLVANPKGWAIPLSIGLNVTSPYGMRLHPIEGVYKMHNGTDYSCNKSHIPIFVVDDGEIVISKYTSKGYGNYVMVKHDDSLYTLYAHMHERFVKEGDIVKKGQVLGTCGTTGSSSGIHLHFEVRTSMTGGHINPESILNSLIASY